jgi:pimeloyl-ACP methyl ester carboxylesterase
MITLSVALLIAAVALVLLLAAGLVIFSAYTARRVELALPPRGRFLDVDGSRIHYLDTGSGPAIVLVHGLGGQMGNFTYALLERLVGEFRVILIDRPGSGYSTRAPGASARCRSQAATIAQFIRKLGIERPLLIGHSLGGAISLAVALDHPECIRGLALIAPYTHLVEKAPAVFESLNINSNIVRWMIAWTVAIPLSIRRGKQVLDAIFSPEDAPADFPTKGGGLLGLRPRSFYNTSIDMISANSDIPNMIERYPSIEVPVSILYGTSDPILDHQIHGLGMRSDVPNLYLELVEGGHMLPVTIPDVTANFIKRAAQRESALPGQDSVSAALPGTK